MLSSQSSCRDAAPCFRPGRRLSMFLSLFTAGSGSAGSWQGPSAGSASRTSARWRSSSSPRSGSSNTFTGEVVHEFTLDNFRTLLENDVYRQITLRTVGDAVAVTIADAILALPIAYYMARVALPRVRAAPRHR